MNAHKADTGRPAWWFGTKQHQYHAIQNQMMMIYDLLASLFYCGSNDTSFKTIGLKLNEIEVIYHTVFWRFLHCFAVFLAVEKPQNCASTPRH